MNQCQRLDGCQLLQGLRVMRVEINRPLQHGSGLAVGFEGLEHHPCMEVGSSAVTPQVDGPLKRPLGQPPLRRARWTKPISSGTR